MVCSRVWCGIVWLARITTLPEPCGNQPHPVGRVDDLRLATSADIAFFLSLHEMPLLCAKCDTDVTIAYFAAPPHVPFRCRCGSQEFVDQPVLPEFKLTENDRRFLRGIKVKGDA